MDYARHYQLLIEKARKRGGVDGHKETHHVVPKSLGGPDDGDNLVELTAREHLIAHLLLWKANPGDFAMTHAAMLMSNRFTVNGRKRSLSICR